MTGAGRLGLATSEIVVLAEAEMPPGLGRQVLALHAQAWPGEGSRRSGPMHDPALRPRSVLVLAGGRVLAALAILSKEITHRGTVYAASGLSAVVTDSAWRRRGFGRRLVSAAREEMAHSGADLGIFTCDPPLRGFYEGAGWQVLPGTVLIGGTPEAPLFSDECGKVAIGCFFSPLARRDAPAFIGSRIALYPGRVDKLW